MCEQSLDLYRTTHSQRKRIFSYENKSCSEKECAASAMNYIFTSITLSHSNFQFKCSLILTENLLVSVAILRVLGFSANKTSAFWVD